MNHEGPELYGLAYGGEFVRHSDGTPMAGTKEFMDALLEEARRMRCAWGREVKELPPELAREAGEG